MCPRQRSHKPRALLWQLSIWFLAGHCLLFAKINLLVVRPDHPAFALAEQGISEELGERIEITRFLLGSRPVGLTFLEALADPPPDLLVLMDSSAVYLYREYQASLEPRATPIPAIVLMTLFLDDQIADLKNVTGIRYEVPGVTALVNLRSVVDEKIDQVGVIYRSQLNGYFGHQKAQCLRENIQLVGVEIKPQTFSYNRSIRQALKSLIRNPELDAIWVLNDRAILDSNLIETAWFPELRHFKKPVVVSVSSLVSEAAPVGHFAVVPDHFQQGAEAAILILEISELQWSAGKFPVRSPLSVKKMLNIKNWPKKMPFRETSLQEMDYLVR